MELIEVKRNKVLNITVPKQVCITIANSFGGNVNQNQPEVDVYISNFTTQLSSTELSLTNELVSTLKTGLEIGTLSDFFDYIFLRNGETKEQSLHNLVKDANHSTLKGLNVPEHIKNRGFRGDLTSSYIEIDYKPSLGTNFKQNDAAYGVYFNPYRATQGGSSYYTGVSKSTSERVLIGHFGSGFITALNCGNTTVAGLTVPSTFNECVILSRSSSANYTKYRNGVASTITATSTSLPNYNMLELAANINGTVGTYNENTVAISFCSKAMTDEQEAIIRNAFKSYVDAKNLINDEIDIFLLNGVNVETFTSPTTSTIYTAYDALVTAYPT